MTTPSDPQTPGENPVPLPPEPTPEEAAAAQAAADQATAEAAQTEAIRALASEIAKQTMLDFDPATLRKGTVASIESTGTPPTVTVTLSGSATTIPGVRYLDSYSPVAGDTVHLLKQTSDVLILGQVNNTPPNPAANGWQTSGGVSYRKVLDNGDFKVQFKGSFTVSGTTLFTLADSSYFPSVPRTLTAGRNGEATSVLVQISTSGVVTISGGTQTLGTTDPGGNGANATGLNTGGASAGTAHVHSMNNHGHSINDHNHTLGGHGHSIDDHNHDMANHGHSIDDHNHTLTLALPTTVYFDGLEFFQ